ncbi:hypothetical protein RFI_29730 [Reticulomyxa filosa]|uniref:Uncharacterized protein n=1 Tax=Reticulomyxa filosa TaxID=46433 RepID=X6M194_RETFI|nr:hypothetical protein RFI_29730 [Reticulomyxa filosa]|eukprot:ETO07659.1 hypothetical protein RFI_29730 [Reticulomyxa filosa]
MFKLCVKKSYFIVFIVSIFFVVLLSPPKKKMETIHYDNDNVCNPIIKQKKKKATKKKKRDEHAPNTSIENEESHTNEETEHTLSSLVSQALNVKKFPIFFFFFFIYITPLPPPKKKNCFGCIESKNRYLTAGFSGSSRERNRLSMGDLSHFQLILSRLSRELSAIGLSTDSSFLSLTNKRSVVLDRIVREYQKEYRVKG